MRATTPSARFDRDAPTDCGPRHDPRPGARPPRSALRFLPLLLVTAALLSLAPGCASRPGGRSAPPLRVAVAPYYPPIVFDDGGRVAGLEADFAAGVAEGLGRPLVYVRMTRQELIPAVQSGRADIAMSGVSITAERSRRVLFTQPYLYVGQLSLIRIEDLGELSRPTALRRPGVRIGYVDGTTGAAYVAENLPNAETVAFATPEEGVRGLRERRVDIFIHDAPTVWRVGSAVDERELMGLYTPLTEEALAWAVSRNDPELRSRIDEMLARWRANGELDRVLNRWIPVRVEIHR